LPATRRIPDTNRSRQFSRRPIHRKPTRSRIFFRTSLLVLAIIAAIFAWAAIARSLTPRSNTTRQSFDAIIVLGTPADSDGNPTPQLLDRITEAVHEYERGVAPRLILTGAAAHNQYVEAEVMARVAESQGVPASVVIEEPHALDTIQNACYSARILSSHGWHSAEIISSPFHLPRAAMIFSHLPANLKLQGWRVHAAPDNLTPGYYSNTANFLEILKTARYLAWSSWRETCNP